MNIDALKKLCEFTDSDFDVRIEDTRTESEIANEKLAPILTQLCRVVEAAQEVEPDEGIYSTLAFLAEELAELEKLVQG